MKLLKPGRKARNAMLTIVIFLTILFFAIPLIISFVISISKTNLDPNALIEPIIQITNTISNFKIIINIIIDNYINIVSNTIYIAAFFNSVILGILTTILCLIIGLPIAYSIHNINTEKIRAFVISIILISFLIPSPIRANALINILNSIGIKPKQPSETFFTICLGMVYCYLPFVIFPIYTALTKIDRSYLEAVSDLGCGPTKTFWRIVIPLSIRGIASACVLTFIMSLGDLVIPELVGNNIPTIGTMISELFSTSDWSLACSLSIITVLLTIILLTIFRVKF
ncbi:MAG: ABC transporter permease [Holosporales bacterium]|nr:ABC transporter permease [Holosporales bacterium]